eukprot:scaffold52888_cov70-Phaeocystis_antarctica.AAC.25
MSSNQPVRRRLDAVAFPLASTRAKRSVLRGPMTRRSAAALRRVPAGMYVRAPAPQQPRAQDLVPVVLRGAFCEQVTQQHARRCLGRASVHAGLLAVSLVDVRVACAPARDDARRALLWQIHPVIGQAYKQAQRAAKGACAHSLPAGQHTQRAHGSTHRRARRERVARVRGGREIFLEDAQQQRLGAPPFERPECPNSLLDHLGAAVLKPHTHEPRRVSGARVWHRAEVVDRAEG